MLKNLSSHTKLFADNISIFSSVKNIIVSTDQANSDLEKISNRAHQWKLSFNPDPKKPAQEVIFSRKRVKDAHPSVLFNNDVVERSASFNDFNAHIKEKINRGIDLTRKLQNKLPRNALFHHL